MRENIWRPSPNCEPRRGCKLPEMIVLHYTGTATAEEAACYYLNHAEDENTGRISAHYMIDRDGSVTQFVDDLMRAWHAGRSYWRGERDINSRSIGIELVNPGHENIYEPFHEAQITALIQLCNELSGKYHIAPEYILGHSDIAPGRKLDPGELLDWKRLAEEGAGRWPEECDVHIACENVHEALMGVGYDPEASPDEVLKAFRLHYVPEAFGDTGEEIVDALTKKRLAGLVKFTG